MNRTQQSLHTPRLHTWEPIARLKGDGALASFSLQQWEHRSCCKTSFRTQSRHSCRAGSTAHGRRRGFGRLAWVLHHGRCSALPSRAGRADLLGRLALPWKPKLRLNRCLRAWFNWMVVAAVVNFCIGVERRQGACGRVLVCWGSALGRKRRWVDIYHR